jgi:hypothetical protein
MKPWNQAAWKQNTYRSSERKMHGPVGDEAYHGVGDAGCCRTCGYFVHAPSCPSQRARETRLPRTSDAPDGWRVAETDCGDEECLACEGAGDFGAACGNGGAPCAECGGLGRVPKTKLLTLSEAAEACRAGKVVRCVDGKLDCNVGVKFAYRYTEQCFVAFDEGAADWRSTLFPRGGCAYMRFEVVA